MTFKELRQNNTIHILDKNDGVKYYQGKVLNVGTPRYDMSQTQQAGVTQMQLPSMVVDVTIEANGKTDTYKFAENASVAGVGNTLFSTDKDGVIREVDATIAHCEQYFSDKERMEKTYEESKKLKGELDTAFKEKQEIDLRFQKMDEKYDNLDKKMDKVLKLLTKED